jgi:uncharacterized membrane protein
MSTLTLPQPRMPARPGTRWVILASALAGTAIAGYLSVTRVAGGEAFCPAGGGGCQKVQASDWMEIGGVYIPFIALAGYLGVVASVFVRGEAGRALGVLLGLVGVGLTSYVTYLQAFVIDGWCPWCVVSTVLMWCIAGLAVRRFLRYPG